MANSISILLEAKDNASAVLRRLGVSLGGVEQHSQAANVQLAAVGATVARAGAAMTLAGGAAAGAGAAIGFKFNSAVEQAEAQLMAFTKSGDETANILKYVKEEAARTQFSFTDMAQAASGLIPASKTSGVALKDLIRQAEILAALNPAEGLTGAAFSLKEALSGDFVSIVERFNLPRKRLNELKEQGVPAMEAISRSLQEMGIDYDLVAKQGETTAARWDQIKDKFTMMAGEYSKPVFDQVSKALEDLPAKIDLARESFDIFISSWREGDNLSEAPGIRNTLGEIAEKGRAVWDAVSNFLSPSIQALGKTWTNDLLPALERARPYLDDIAKIAGGVLVAALWLAINVLNFLASSIANIINQAVTFGQIVRNVVNATVAAFSWFGDTVGGILWSVGDTIKNAFNGAYEFVKTLPGKMVGLFVNLGSDIRRVIGNIDIPGPLGLVKNVIPGFAAGGYTGAGPASQIAGVVHRGEYVVPKEQVDQTTGRPKGGGVTIHQTNYFNNAFDYDAATERLGWELSRA